MPAASPPVSRTPPVTPAEAGAPPVGAILLGGLIAARWLMPVESAALGDTLPLVQITLVYAAYVLWRCVRDGLRWNRLSTGDWLALGLVAAHVLSGLAVVATSGQKRAALNFLWEWVGTGALWGLFAIELKRLQILDRLFGALALATILLAGFGIWQNIVVYPQLRSLLDEYDRLEARAGSLSPSENTRFRELQGSLPASYSQGDAASRQMFSARVRGSQEPLGMFALANSFGGFLLVGAWLVWGRIALWRESAEGSRAGLALLAAGLGLIVVCLVLTKARTAWAGGLAGIGVWTLLSLRRRDLRRLIAPLAVVAGLVLLLVGGGLATGRLDVETFREAPKSVRYRLEYWQSTLAMLRDHPWFGSGLGNFRQHYLQYKLPESSEEIVDPHNFVLDVWANAGLPGFLLLLSLLAVVLRGLSSSGAPERSDSENLESRGQGADPKAPVPAAPLPGEWWWLGLAMGQAGIVLAAIAMLLSGTDPIEGLLWLLPTWWLVGIPFEKATGPAIPRAAYAAAWCSYTVHLLGAGGIETPGLSQLWLLLTARLLWSAGPVATPAVVRENSPLGWGATLAAGGLAVGCALSATVPVLGCQSAIRIGQDQMQVRQNLSAAMKSFQEASRADRFDPEPWVQQSFVSEIRWQRATDDHHFGEAVKQVDEARKRNPADPFLVRMEGLLWLARFDRTKAPADARKAAEKLAEAVRRYPHHAALRADLARSLVPVSLAEAREAARQALAQNDINLQYGHLDKALPDPVRKEMEELAAAAPLPTGVESPEMR